MSTLEALGITAEKIQSYDCRIPRYTSYPTAPIWREDFDGPAWREHLQKSPSAEQLLSLYVHIPFCEKHCLFCACNTIITTKKDIAADYLDWVEKEATLVRDAYRADREVVQLNLGGGTPNYLTQEQMSRLLKILESRFRFGARAERSIEVDPRLATPADIRAFFQVHGFRRISFGVQDFHDDTQLAIGREQTRDITFANVAAAREAGFGSVNIDIIYGLPRQTEKSWSETIGSIIELRPDRLALYNFAYLPTKLAHQRALSHEELPGPAMKLQMFIEAHNRLTAAGYDFIGMDHYALRTESLSRAKNNGTLRRNFMGYTTWRGTDILAFGISAISDFQGVFAQNTKKLSVYKKQLAAGVLPTERGLILSPDDTMRRFVIEELMCNGVLNYDSDCGVPGVDLRAVVDEEAEALRVLAEDNLIVFEPNALRVTEKGRIFLRNIAVVFDAYMKGEKGNKTLFSRAV